MSLLDKMAMNTAMKRLKDYHIAPKDAKPIDYDTAARPGYSQGSGILLLTNEALYFGLMGKGSEGAKRIPLDDIGSTEIRNDDYLVLDKDKNLIISLQILSKRKNFKTLFLQLGRE